MAQDATTKEIARQFTGERCYLNGAPAKISGRLNRFGTVAPLDPKLPSEEWSWHAINRIMRKGGFFET